MNLAMRLENKIDALIGSPIDVEGSGVIDREDRVAIRRLTAPELVVLVERLDAVYYDTVTAVKILNSELQAAL